jgi:hypothetical protein
MESLTGFGIVMFHFTIQLNQCYLLGGGVETGAFASLVLTLTYSRHI